MKKIVVESHCEMVLQRNNLKWFIAEFSTDAFELCEEAEKKNYKK